MDEKLHTVIRPHPPLPFPNLRDQNHLEIDPIRVDAIIHAVIWLDPVSIHITWIGLLAAKAPVDENVLNASRPERQHRGSQSLQKPTRRRGVNPNRPPISSSVARWSPVGNSPVAGSKAGITPPPSWQGQTRMSTLLLSL